jgi:hypothetical protein
VKATRQPLNNQEIDAIVAFLQTLTDARYEQLSAGSLIDRAPTRRTTLHPP